MGELLKDYTKVNFQKIHKDSTVGVINGMWAGRLGIGGVLPIESSWIPAQNRNYIKATGSLEKVIQESIEVANTLAWNFLDKKVKKKSTKADVVNAFNEFKKALNTLQETCLAAF